MIEGDTIRLLRECDAGIKMGVKSIDEVLEDTENRKFEELLMQCKDQHEKLKDEAQAMLTEYQDEGKEPNPIAKSMSWMKTSWKLMAEKSDATIADLITDGCNMGVKSLARYLNQYEAASEKSKDIAKRLIALEDTLAKDIREFL